MISHSVLASFQFLIVHSEKRLSQREIVNKRSALV